MILPFILLWRASEEVIVQNENRNCYYVDISKCLKAVSLFQCFMVVFFIILFRGEPVSPRILICLHCFCTLFTLIVSSGEICDESRAVNVCLLVKKMS